MQVEIYINEEKLDTDAKTKIAETRQINDFFDIRDRQTSYTPTFKLPLTDRNKKLLGAMSIAGNTSLAPYRIHKVSVYREGIQTISEGIGYFKPTTDYFNMYVYNDNINLFDTIGDKSLADLNLTPLNHNLNIESWLNSFSRKDYIYPVADYGKLDGNTIEVNYQVPALFVKYLWNKIFNENGYEYKYVGRGNQQDYNPFVTDEWEQTAISIDEGFPTQKESVDPVKKLELFKNQTSQYKGKTVNYFGNEIVVQALTGEVNEYIRFGSVFDEEGLHQFSSSAQYNRSRIRIKESGFYKINVNGDFYNLVTENASMYIEKDGYNLFAIKEDLPENQSSVGFSQKIYLREGDELFVKVTTLPKDHESYYSYDITFELWLDNTVTAVNFSSYLSKIKQKDFIKDVMHFYGLMCRRKRNTYEFISFEELLDPLAVYVNYDAIENNAVYDDWSHKFHRVVEENTKVGNYAKNNLFKYRYDNPENTFADAVIKVDDDTLITEKTLIQRPYRAPDNSTTAISNSFLKECIFYEKQYNDDGSLKAVKPRKTSPFFFKVESRNATVSYKLSGAVGSSDYTGVIPFMSFEGLDFNNVLPNRYTAFANMINYGKKIKVELYLSVLDIHNLDFFRLKYIKQLGALYYLSKPIKFTESGLTKAELIKIKAIEKRGEFSDDFNSDFNI